VSDCILLYEGDRLLYKGRLCEITQVSHDGVMVKDGAVSRFLFCTELRNIKLEWRIEFAKGKYSGYSHTPMKEKAEKEKRFLEEQGWTCKTYQVQVV